MARLSVPIGSIEVFAEAARLGSFKLAADSLSYTPSAISQAVRKLEDRLGCQLFERMGNRVSLTGEGRILFADISEGLNVIRAGINKVRQGIMAPFSFSSPPGIATQLLSPMIASILTSLATDVRVVADESPDYSSYKEFDVAILYGEEAGKLEGLQSLGPDVFIPVCRPDLADGIGSAKDVLKLPLLVNETNAVSWEDWLRLNGVSHTAPKTLTYNRAAYIIPALLQGAGIGLESLRILSPQIASGALVVCNVLDGKSIKRDLTFLHITKDAGRCERAQTVADDICLRCMTGEDGNLLRPYDPS